MKRDQATEAAYLPEPGTEVPDLSALPGVEGTRLEPPVDLREVHVDTSDLRLTYADVRLCRRTGGADPGWCLEVPTDHGCEELHAPPGRSARIPPQALRDLLVGWTRGFPLAPVATVRTARSERVLLDAHGGVLARLTDDRVEGTSESGEQQTWREWRLELVGGAPGLLAEADELFAGAGVSRASVEPVLGRVLGDPLRPRPQPRAARRQQAVSRVVHPRLATQVRVLGMWDVEARRGDVEGVHEMRVTSRRLRGALATFRPVLDSGRTDHLRQELRWLVGVLGGSRDAAVARELLENLLRDEPRSLVRGPVRRRVRSTYAGRGEVELRTTLQSPRYFALRDQLDELVDDPPWTVLAQSPAAEVAPDLLARELVRFLERHTKAASAADQLSALHEVRKAAKRLRYAAEALEPIGGAPGRRLVQETRRVTSHLGDLQDSEVCRAALADLSTAAAAAGEPTFTYGRLDALVQSRAEDLAAEYWASEALETLELRTHQAMAAISGG